MTIDEAIKFCYKKAKNIKLKAEPQVFIDIAELLEELKATKNSDIPIIHGKEELELHDNAIRNKAIDDFTDYIRPIISEYVCALKNNRYAFIDIGVINRKLKAGGKNENYNKEES